MQRITPANGHTPINSNGETAIVEPPAHLAIIGMSCRLPGEVTTPEELWDLCSRGRSAWSEFPESRFNASAFYHPNPDRPGSFNAKGGHFIKEDAGLFDAPFFHFTLQEARSLDPQQRMMLECVYEALENAGLATHSIARNKVGVFTGASFPDYELNNMKDVEAGPILSKPASWGMLDCNCSWDAFELDARELRLHDTFQVSDSGRSYAFDSRGTGFGRGEGAGCIVLRTLEEAQAAGDAVRAVIINSGINQDGRTRGITMPNGHDKRAVIQRAKDLEAYLVRNPPVFDCNLLENLAYTIGQRRDFFPWRLAISSSTDKELELFFSNLPEPYRALQELTVAFVFTGQGVQWHGMGRELLKSYQIFRRTLEAVDKCLAKFGAGFFIIDEIVSSGPCKSSLSVAYISQPACTAIQLGLTDLLSSWHIAPSAVTGHSSGEIAAAYAARILTLEECVRIAYARGLAARTLSDSTKITHTQGAMLAVGASVEEVQPCLKSLRDGRAVIACVNSGSRVTVSGDEIAIVDLQSTLDERGLFTRRLNVDVAYHSHHMQLVSQQYRSLIGNISPQPSEIPFYSAVYSRAMLADGLHADYWVDILVFRFEFVHALESLLMEKTKVTTILEIGPHCALQTPVKEIIEQQSQSRNAEYSPSLRRKVDAVEALQQLAVSLFLRGFPHNLESINFPGMALTKRRPALLTNLPKYPWNHSERYWHSSRLTANLYHRKFARNDILGSLCMENIDFEPRWRNIIQVDDHPWIRQHKVHRNNLYPTTGFLAMEMEAITQQSAMHNISIEKIDIRDVAITRMLAISDGSTIETMLTLRPCRNETPGESIGSWHEFKLFSWAEGRGWDQHCHGLIKAQENGKEISKIRAAWEVEYGPVFRGLTNIAIGDDHQAMAKVNVPNTKACMPYEYETESTIHPATLDICCQMEWVLRGYAESGSNMTFMPSRVKNISVSLIHPVQAGAPLHVFAHQPAVLSTGHPCCTRILAMHPMTLALPQ
ncbi:hypothetical protein BBP40_000669 [Aspergillus hancockii]|nr:hypothetical protein BBP40_000669 [Aspergillus hancockii]